MHCALPVIHTHVVMDGEAQYWKENIAGEPLMLMKVKMTFVRLPWLLSLATTQTRILHALNFSGPILPQIRRQSRF
jgi:hypothetical protein